MPLHRLEPDTPALDVAYLILRFLIWGGLGGLTVAIGGYVLIDLAAAFVGLFAGFLIGGLVGVGARLHLSEKASSVIKKAAGTLAAPPAFMAFLGVTNLMGAMIGADGLASLISMVIGAIAGVLIWFLGAVILFLVIGWIWMLIKY